jgi:hypothetical protein
MGPAIGKGSSSNAADEIAAPHNLIEFHRIQVEFKALGVHPLPNKLELPAKLAQSQKRTTSHLFSIISNDFRFFIDCRINQN